MRYKRRPQQRDSEDDEDLLSENLAAVNDRLDDLARQLERVARSNTRHDDDRQTDRVSEAVARLDRRLDQIVAESRAAATEAERRVASMPMPPAPVPMPTVPPPMPMAAPPARGPQNWASEISARQRALDGEPAMPQRAAAPAPAPAWLQPQQPPGQDLTGLEHHLRSITNQIATLHRPYEDAMTALRGDLAEIGRALTDALPRRAIEALETEVRALAERVDRTRHAGANGQSLANLEQGLAEIRQTLQHLTPAESLAGVDEAVRGLSRKIDQISLSSGNQDPAAFQHLEHAIASLRGVVSNVASDGALAQLAAEVHNLASHFERAIQESGAEALQRLDSRIEALMHSGRSVPPELEASIRQLSERIERMPLTHGDQLALGSLEDRIVQLFEKLDASEARLSSLGSMERGIADLLVAVEEMRKGGGPRGPREPPHEPPRQEAPRYEPPPPAPVVQAAPVPYAPPPAHEPSPPPPPAAPAMAPAPAPASVAPPPKAMQPHHEPRRPLNPNLPPDTPLEPGSGVPRSKPGSPAARIAASEAALGSAKPAIPEPKTSAVAAARSAAKSAVAQAPAAPPPDKKKKAFEMTEEDAAVVAAATERAPARGSIVKHIKTVMIAASVVAIVLGVLYTAMELFFSGDAPEGPVSAPEQTTAPPPAPPAATAPPPSTVPSRPMPTPEGSLPPPPASDPATTNSTGRQSMFDPSTILQSLPTVSQPDVTGSVPRRTPRAAASAPAPSQPGAPPQTTAGPPPADAAGLPASIGPTLRTAAASGDPAAAYEIAIRYADGRGVAANLEEAARWLERAARAGFTPAQFRLASMSERGEGVRKDLPGARRLYIAAAEKGHAKAMHNLAVLHAEGVDGKPDYKTAAQWFRRAAGYGVSDSQFNLAILYARGIGVEQNLAESYKWFALAAAKGDRDAGKKRDDVAARLDQSSLMAAKLAAQTFVAEREPEEATNLKAPPGGWERVGAAPAARAKGRTSAAQSQ